MDKGIEAICESVRRAPLTKPEGLSPAWQAYFDAVTPLHVAELIAALEQAQQEKSHLEYRLKNVQDAFLAGDERALRAERRVSELEKTLRGTEESLIAAVDQIAELESAPNGMMQLSNELAEMKRKLAEMEVACDRSYIDGMKTGWNYCDAGNGEGFNKCIEHRRALISAGGTVEGGE